MTMLEETIRLMSKAAFFHGAQRPAIESLVRESEIVHLPPDEVIINEGEYEMVCYVIIRGWFKVSVTDKETGEHRMVRELGPGDLLGEMSVLSGAPRAAEVKSLQEALLLRVDRDHFLRFVDAAPSVRERLDDGYRERALVSALKMVDVFTPIESPTMAQLARKVELKMYQKGEVIFLAGDPPDAFYLIRDGFVKVSREIEQDESSFFDSRFDKAVLDPTRERETREFILGYLGQGAYFGERALFDNRPRTASISALTRVEVVRISRKHFESLMITYPEVRAAMKTYAASRYTDQPKQKIIANQDMLQWAASQDMLAADNILILDLDLCVRCLHCIDTCAKLHNGVSRITHDGIQYKNILIPTSCRHCREPTCMIGCPTGAIQRDIQGEVFHTDACIGCGNCARRCPFGNISMVQIDRAGGKQRLSDKIKWMVKGKTPFTIDFGNGDGVDADKKHGPQRRAVKCDMCMDYKYLGCEHNCPAGAIQTVKPSEYFGRMLGA